MAPLIARKNALRFGNVSTSSSSNQSSSTIIAAKIVAVARLHEHWLASWTNNEVKSGHYDEGKSFLLLRLSRWKPEWLTTFHAKEGRIETHNAGHHHLLFQWLPLCCFYQNNKWICRHRRIWRENCSMMEWPDMTLLLLLAGQSTNILIILANIPSYLTFQESLIIGKTDQHHQVN